LACLDIETVMEAGKKTVRKMSSAQLGAVRALPLEGYEIHLGRTTGPDMVAAVRRHQNGTEDGAVSGRRQSDRQL